MKKLIILMIAMIVFASCSKDNDPKLYCVRLTETSWNYNGNDGQCSLNFHNGILSYIKKLENGTEWQTYSYKVFGNDIKFIPAVNGLDSLDGYFISEDKINLINHTTKKTVVLSME